MASGGARLTGEEDELCRGPQADPQFVFKYIDTTTLMGFVKRRRDGTDESDPDWLLVDVRDTDEVMEHGLLCPSAVNLPKSDLFPGLCSLSPEQFQSDFGVPRPRSDQMLIFCCSSGVRSQLAARMAASCGFTNVFNYPGGAQQWYATLKVMGEAATDPAGTGHRLM